MAKAPRNRQLNPIEFKDFSEESRKLVERLSYVVNPFIRETSAVLDGGVASENLSEVVLEVDFQVTEDQLYPGTGGGGPSGGDATFGDLTSTGLFESTGSALFSGPTSFTSSVTFGGPVTFTNITSTDDVTANDLVVGKNGVWAGTPPGIASWSSTRLTSSSSSVQEPSVEFYKATSLNGKLGYSGIFFGDTNFHVYSSDPIDYNTAGATHTFKVGGTTRATIDATGLTVNGALVSGTLNVTGTATFANISTPGTLTVGGNTTLGDAAGDTTTINGTAVSIPNNLNIDSNTLTVNATTDVVGINTTTPDGSTSLHISSAGTEFPIFLDRYTASASNQMSIVQRTARGTQGSPSAVQTSDIIGAVTARAYGATAFSPDYRAGLFYRATQTWTDTAQGTGIGIFVTPNGSITPAEKITVLNSGNVGINDVSPSDPLSVGGNIRSSNTITAFNQMRLGATNGQFVAFTEDNKTTKFANYFISNSDQSGMGRLFLENYLCMINTNASRRLGFYLDLPDFGTASTLTTNANMYIKPTGVEIRDALTVDGGTFSVDATNNRAGFGTTTPGFPVHIASQSTTQPHLMVDQAAAAATGPSIGLRAARGTLASPTATQSADQLGVVGFRGRGSTVYSTADRAAVVATASQTWTDTAQGSQLDFFTTGNGTTTTSARMTVQQDGRVVVPGTVEAGVVATESVVGSDITLNAIGPGAVNLQSGSTTLLSVDDSNGVQVQGLLQVQGSMTVTAGTFSLQKTDSSGTPGAVTNNSISGKAAIALGASSVTVTNDNTSTTSIILITPLDLDTTLTSFKVAAGSGSFTVTGNTVATAAWRFNFLVIS